MDKFYKPRKQKKGQKDYAIPTQNYINLANIFLAFQHIPRL